MNFDRLARRAPGLTMTGLALAGAVVTLLPGAVSAQDTTTDVGVLDGEPSTMDCSAIETDPAQLGAASIYIVDAAQSEARYIAQEELANIGANTAVGTTSTIQGAFLFDADGNPIPCSTVYVDVRTFVSDSSRRDNFLRGNTLQSDQFPLAEFVVTGIEDFTLPADGEETTFTLVGNFTLHGVTKPMAWSVTATREGNTLTGSANTEFDMADFNIEKPIVGSVISIEDTIELEIDLVAVNQAA
jgi:polyisoprenoid-binding protein YceI